MNIENEILALRSRLNALEQAFIQAQRNNITVTAKADEVEPLKKNVEDITPYKETKTAYIDDTTLTFENVPTGNLSVFSTVSEYNVNRDEGTVIIDFGPLEEVTEFTIMVQ